MTISILFISFKTILLILHIIWMSRSIWSIFYHSSIFVSSAPHFLCVFSPYDMHVRSLLLFRFTEVFFYPVWLKETPFHKHEWTNKQPPFLFVSSNSNSLIAPLPLRNSLVYLTLFYVKCDFDSNISCVYGLSCCVYGLNALTIPSQFNDLIKCVFVYVCVAVVCR